MIITAVGVGLVIGALIGLLGGGGSILAVPALVYAVGAPVDEAIPLSLLVVGLAAIIAVIPRIRSGEVSWRIAGVFGLAGFAAAFGGSAVNKLLPEPVVLAGLAVVMVVAGVRMLREQETSSDGCELPGGKINWRSCLPKAIAAGVGVGFLTGLFGVGGGFLIIPALVLLMGLPMDTAVGTSLVIIVVNSVAGFIGHLGGAEIDWGLAAAFTAAALPASYVGARFASKVPNDKLRKWFAYLVLAVAAFVLVQVVLAL